jgi:hypothetical protein
MPQDNVERQAADRTKARQREDELVLALYDVVTACRSDGTEAERFAAIEAILGERAETLLAQCDEHLAYAIDSAHEALEGPDSDSGDEQQWNRKPG